MKRTGKQRRQYGHETEQHPLVEFSPQAFEARRRYARELVTRQRIGDGCAQYAAAAQLNPSERDVFRTIMRLRRSNPDSAKTVRSCIVDGSPLSAHTRGRPAFT